MAIISTMSTRTLPSTTASSSSRQAPTHLPCAITFLRAPVTALATSQTPACSCEVAFTAPSFKQCRRRSRTCVLVAASQQAGQGAAQSAASRQPWAQSWQQQQQQHDSYSPSDSAGWTHSPYSAATSRQAWAQSSYDSYDSYPQGRGSNGPNEQYAWPQAALPQARPPQDQLAAFRAFQQAAQKARERQQQGSQGSSPQQGGPSAAGQQRQGSWQEAWGAQGGEGYDDSVSGDSDWGSSDMMSEGGAGEESMVNMAAAFRRSAAPRLQKGWYAAPGLTAAQLHDEILRRSEHTSLGPWPIFMMTRIARTPEDARLTLAAVMAVRASAARLKGDLRPLGGERLAVAFVRMCITCDAPDVLGAAVRRANEAGLKMTYRGVHEGLRHWAQLMELHKMDEVLAAMPAGGLPITTRTAYIAIRAAVNSGRQAAADAYAAYFQKIGVRLNNTTLQLLDLGRQRARAMAAAMSESKLDQL